MTEKRNEDDLASMSLGDHLDELRSRLMLGLSGLAAAFVISLAAGKWFLAIILSPYQTAMKDAAMDVKLQAIEVAEPFMVYLKRVSRASVALLKSSPP